VEVFFAMLGLRVAAILVAVAGVSTGCMGDTDEDARAPVEAAATTAESASTGKSSTDVFARIPTLVEQVQPSVVTVAVQGQGGKGEGSGVIWDDEGTIITNEHVVSGSQQVEVVLANGVRLPADVEAASRDFDLAVLGVEREGLPAAEFAEELPRVGSSSSRSAIRSGSRIRSRPGSSRGCTARFPPAVDRPRSST
jgi:serine protease DegQ